MGHHELQHRLRGPAGHRGAHRGPPRTPPNFLFRFGRLLFRIAAVRSRSVGAAAHYGPRRAGRGSGDPPASLVRPFARRLPRRASVTDCGALGRHRSARGGHGSLFRRRIDHCTGLAISVLREPADRFRGVVTGATRSHLFARLSHVRLAGLLRGGVAHRVVGVARSRRLRGAHVAMVERSCSGLLVRLAHVGRLVHRALTPPPRSGTRRNALPGTLVQRCERRHTALRNGIFCDVTRQHPLLDERLALLDLARRSRGHPGAAGGCGDIGTGRASDWTFRISRHFDHRLQRVRSGTGLVGPARGSATELLRRMAPGHPRRGSGNWSHLSGP